jgi:hypothetical protein
VFAATQPNTTKNEITYGNAPISVSLTECDFRSTAQNTQAHAAAVSSAIIHPTGSIGRYTHRRFSNHAMSIVRSSLGNVSIEKLCTAK